MQEEEKIYKKINYRSPIKYFINTYIREYDLSKANISSLYYTGRITKEKYNEFMNIDKQSREVKIGLMIQKDNSIYRSIQKGIIEAKKRLVESNQLTDFDILSIKNEFIIPIVFVFIVLIIYCSGLLNIITLSSFLTVFLSIILCGYVVLCLFVIYRHFCKRVYICC